MLGMLLGWAIVAAMHNQGITHLAFPVQQLLVIAVLAVLAGFVAAIARQAPRRARHPPSSDHRMRPGHPEYRSGCRSTGIASPIWPGCPLLPSRAVSGKAAYAR